MTNEIIKNIITNFDITREETKEEIEFLIESDSELVAKIEELGYTVGQTAEDIISELR